MLVGMKDIPVVTKDEPRDGGNDASLVGAGNQERGGRMRFAFHLKFSSWKFPRRSLIQIPCTARDFLAAFFWLGLCKLPGREKKHDG
jgi:hypothetical protein